MSRHKLVGPVFCATITGLPGCVISTNAVPFERPMSAYSRPDGDV
jgi:hypothetical protein